MKQNILILLLVTLFTSSCIPKKDLVYFQGESSKKLTQIVNEPYKLQVNDIIDIRIKADDEKLVAMFSQQTSSASRMGNQFNAENLYFTSYSIDQHGNIRMPYLGNINVLGYTEKEVVSKIQNELKKYFKDTTGIFITVKLAGIRFVVMGEVEQSGTKVLYQNQVSIIEAIANSGDIKITGDRKNVMIYRKSGEETKQLVVDFTNINMFNSSSYYIQPNDVIYVKPLKQKSWGTGTTGLQTLTTIVSIASLITSAILITKSFN